MVFASWTRYAWDFCLAPRPVGDDEPYQLSTSRSNAGMRSWPTGGWPSRAPSAGPARRTSSPGGAALTPSSPASPAPGRRAGFWPGCIVERDGLHHLFYTGRPRGPWRPPHDNPTDVQIGLATSSDLRVWTRHPANPLIVDAGPKSCRRRRPDAGSDVDGAAIHG